MNDEQRWTVRVAGSDGSGVTVFVRRRQFPIGVPISFDDEYEQTTALEHFIAAVGSDIVSGLRIRAKRRRVEIDEVEATVECVLDNPLTFLEVVGEEGHPGVRELRVIVYISTLADASEVERLWKDTLLRSPMIQTLKNAVKLEASYKVVL